MNEEEKKPDSHFNLSRIRKAVRWSRRQLGGFRRARRNRLLEVRGSKYTVGITSDEATKAVPLNVLELAIRTYQRQISSRRPRANTTTEYPELKRTASILKLAVNKKVKDIKFGEELDMITFDALVSIGIIKVAKEPVSKTVFGKEEFVKGRVYARSIDLDDWVHDMGATRWDDVEFMGNRNRMRLSDFKKSSMYKRLSSEDKEKVKASRLDSYDEEGNPRVEGLSKEDQSDASEAFDHFETWDLYFPHDNKVITICMDNEELPILEEKTWKGFPGGPYRILGFGKLPSNTMPMPPSAQWEDLHELANFMMRKLARQATRQKTVLGVQASGKADAKRIRNASDGQIISLDNPNNAKEYAFGGIDQASLTFLQVVREMASTMGGNIDALAGLGPSSDTVGQDRLISASATQQVKDMQDRVTEFVAEVLQMIGWYIWNDPTVEMNLFKRLEGTPVTIPVTFDVHVKEGDFLDYNISVEPYSLQYKTPNERLQVVMQVVQTMLVPFAEQMAAQGIAIDFEGLLRIIADYSDMKELADVVTFKQPQQDAIGPVSRGRGKSGPAQPADQRVSGQNQARQARQAAASLPSTRPNNAAPQTETVGRS